MDFIWLNKIKSTSSKWIDNPLNPLSVHAVSSTNVRLHCVEGITFKSYKSTLKIYMSCKTVDDQG